MELYFKWQLIKDFIGLGIILLCFVIALVVLFVAWIQRKFEEALRRGGKKGGSDDRL